MSTGEANSKTTRILIVGGVAGGASAAARARRLDENASIVVLERGQEASFANCGLPYYIGGEIAERSSLLVADDRQLKDWLNLDVRTGSEVTSIDRKAREVEVCEIKSGRTYRLTYDYLILSTGAAPIRPSALLDKVGADHPRVLSLRNMTDVDRIKSIVDAAADFGTYVCAHAYTDSSINRVLDAGGRCIEHGFLASEKTIKRMKKLGAVMSLQPYAAVEIFKEPEKLAGFGEENIRKARQVRDGADNMLKLVAKHKVDTFAGADLWQEGIITKTPEDMVVRKHWFSDVEILRQNTSYAAKWLAKSGTKNPYREGSLGVIEEGAYADMLLVDGNPVEDVSVLADWKKNIRLIVKDGEIYKNTL